MHNACTCHGICTDQRTTSDIWVPWMDLKVSAELPGGSTNSPQV